MTFRKSLYFSIAVHLLIFSSAIAIAQYVGGSFVSFPQAVQVSLVSPDPGIGAGTATIRQQSIRLRAELDQPVDMPVERQQDASPEFSSDLSRASKAPDDGNAIVTGKVDDQAGNDTRGKAIASPDAAQAGDTGMGFIAPEQWAAIEAAFERTKSYPRLARERGIEGMVRLRFRLNFVGGVEAVEVMQSSGYEILDSASIRAVYRAAPMPPVQGWVEMPMKYVLK